jgi:hypothetical protein
MGLRRRYRGIGRRYLFCLDFFHKFTSYQKENLYRLNFNLSSPGLRVVHRSFRIRVPGNGDVSLLYTSFICL